MTIQQILPKLKATSRTFKNIEYKMIVGYKKYYELAKDNQDYGLHELDVRELTRILNLHTDDFSKKLCALSHLRAVLNHRISSNTKQESKTWSLEQRIKRLEEAVGVTKLNL